MTMLDLSQINRIYLATGKTDLRKGIDGLVVSSVQLDGFQVEANHYTITSLS